MKKSILFILVFLAIMAKNSFAFTTNTSQLDSYSTTSSRNDAVGEEILLTKTSKQQLAIYPNPLVGNVLTIPNMKGAAVRLLSLLGQELHSWPNIDEQITIHNITSGIYLLEVLHKGQRKITKIVVK